MQESLQSRKTRTKAIIQKLKRYYPEAECALVHDNPLELLVATILSAQCTDVRVNIVTRELFTKYRSAQDFAQAALADLEQIIKPTGFFRSKAKNLKGVGELLVRDHNGEVPKSVEDLTRLPGVGRKTANVVLGVAYRLATGIVVDTHVKRLAFRLGLSKVIEPAKIEQELMALVPQKEWIDFSHRLIFHGRQICKARKPKCEVCPLEELCPQRGVKSIR